MSLKNIARVRFRGAYGWKDGCLGVSAIEYAFIAALVAMAIIAAVTALGLNLNVLYTRVLNAFQ